MSSRRFCRVLLCLQGQYLCTSTTDSGGLACARVLLDPSFSNRVRWVTSVFQAIRLFAACNSVKGDRPRGRYQLFLFQMIRILAGQKTICRKNFIDFFLISNSSISYVYWRVSRWLLSHSPFHRCRNGAQISQWFTSDHAQDYYL